jgi:hypothetical protein
MLEIISIVTLIVALIKGEIRFSRERYVPAKVSRITAGILLFLVIYSYASGQTGTGLGSLIIFGIVAACTSKRKSTAVPPPLPEVTPVPNAHSKEAEH